MCKSPEVGRTEPQDGLSIEPGGRPCSLGRESKRGRVPVGGEARGQQKRQGLGTMGSH